MKLLVKQVRSDALAAHIPDPDNRPLCGAALKLADWAVEDRQPGSITVCGNCRRAIRMSRKRNEPPAQSASL